MTIADILAKAQKRRLRTEMEVFLAYLLGVGRLDLIAHGEDEVPVEKLADLQKGWAKIEDGVPVAYLTGQKEFYGLDFYVDERVLVPRGETERLVEWILALAVERSDIKRVLEVGTGCGAIAVALKKTKPELDVVAMEVSEEALEVANKNVVQHGVDVRLIQSDLLEDMPDEGFDVLVANLPYIGEEENNFISENVEKHEPHVALFGGEDGLRLYSRMFEQVAERRKNCELNHRGNFRWIMGEIGFTQGEGISELAEELLPGYECEVREDYQGLTRYFVLSV